MKRIFTIVLLSLIAFGARSQTNTLLTLYAGGGLTPKYNYDIGISGGFTFEKGIGNRTALGVTLFYQSYAFLYDNEAYGAKNGTGNGGVTLLNKSSYIFLAPRLSHGFGWTEAIKYYVDAGAGFKMSGTEKYRKWDNSYGSAYGNYDSTIATDANLSSLVIRVGIGLSEYIHLGGKWWFSFSEDCGFLANPVSKTGDIDNTSPARTRYSPNKLNPAYFSLHLGITHSRF